MCVFSVCHYLLQYHVIFSFKWESYPRADEVEQGADVKRSATKKITAVAETKM